MITSFQRSAGFYGAELDFICLIVFLLSLFCPPPPAAALQPSARARADAEPHGSAEDGGQPGAEPPRILGRRKEAKGDEG